MHNRGRVNEQVADLAASVTASRELALLSEAEEYCWRVRRAAIAERDKGYKMEERSPLDGKIWSLHQAAIHIQEASRILKASGG
jgi:hypothetical protein